MSGILENMQNAIVNLQNEVAALKAAAAAAPVANQFAAAPVANQFGAADPFAAPTAGAVLGGVAAVSPPAVQNVTSEMITALIQPHIENDAIKAALGVEMRAMGINALPETQPQQYAELYQRFSNVISRYAAAPAPAAAPAAGGASII